MGRTTNAVLVVVLSIVAGVGAWAVLRFTAPNFLRSVSSTDVPFVSTTSDAERWEQAIAKVKEDRGVDANSTALEVPPELRHYPERRWFLATQVAEVRKHNLATCQDFLDVAAKLQSGELVGVPAVTDTFRPRRPRWRRLIVVALPARAVPFFVAIVRRPASSLAV